MRKLLAVLIFAALVFPLLMGALSLMAVSQWALDRDFYEQLLGDVRLYEVLLDEDLPNYLNNRYPVPEADMIPSGALSNALRQVVTAEDLRAQSLRLVDNVFNVLEGRSDQFDLYLDTTQIKATVLGSGGAKFARALATSLPACADDQPAVAGGAVMMRCVPSDMSVDEAEAQIAAALPAFVNSVPDRIDLNREPVQLRGGTRGLDLTWVAVNALNFGIVIMLFMAGGAWALNALLAGENSRERLLWLGGMLALPAALIFFIGLTSSSPFVSGWVRFGLNEARFGDGVAYSLAFRDAASVVFSQALRTIANGFLTAGGAAGAIALGLIVWGAMTPAQRPTPPRSVSPATPAAQTDAGKPSGAEDQSGVNGIAASHQS